MATAVISVPQQVPHMSIPHIPRVRPPRILKGTPSPNSVPQPPGRAPRKKVWAQGQWRSPTSNSAKASRDRQSRQVEKALRHETHGQNIYAYANLRTHQVVYSLTRIMNNNKILPQLVYHGKKTVPAALRRDHWTPYFSLHFPPNEYGSSSGLLAYHQLRELSKQRQLAPPEDMVITTQEDIDRIKARWDPIELEDMLKNKELILPQVGQLLPKELRAKKLMSQRATSVADVAFVLGLQAEAPGPEEAARLKEERRASWWNNISRGAKARARKRAKLQEGKEEQLEKRRQVAMKAEPGGVGLNSDAAKRIAMEYRGVLAPSGHKVDLARRGEGMIGDIAVVEERDQERDQEHVGKVGTNLQSRASRPGDAVMTAQGKREREQSSPQTAETGSTDPSEASVDEQPSAHSLEAAAAVRAAVKKEEESREIRVLWADLRDAAYAERWPETVVHAELERMAVAKGKKMVAGGTKELLVPRSRSVHVIGGQKGSGWYLDRDELEESKRQLTQWYEALDPHVERGEDKGAEGSSEAAAAAAAEGGETNKEYYTRRQDAADALREKGIEVEPPRRGLWSTVKGLFGR